MTEKLTMARPYAKAAFSYALANRSLDEWSVLLDNLAKVTLDKRVIKIIHNPTFTRSKLAEFISSFSTVESTGKQPSADVTNFIKVLAEYNRLELLPEIAELFEALKLKYNKAAEVSIKSAVEMTADQQEKLGKALEKKLGVKVNLNFSVDADLIGGIIVKNGDLVIDGSIKGQLNKLSTKLAA